MIVTAALVALFSGEAAPQLRIDPLLITRAAEVWNVIAAPDNPVWPGWNASDTPLLIYLPGQQDVLINHPSPPEGFELYDGPRTAFAGRIAVKQGPTIEHLDGQNTVRDVGGVDTLVVADTLSTRRQWVGSVVDLGRSDPEGVGSAIEEGLLPSPYETMTLFAHEAFHAYQNRRAPDKGGSEVALLRYPSLSVENNVGFALEGDLLRRALLADDPVEMRRNAVQWLAVRKERRRTLRDDQVRFEDGAEFNEGLAKYVEYSLLERMEGRAPAPEMWFIQGFHGYGDLSAERLRLLDTMQKMMAGQASVNNDPYGASPVRMRLYFSGMAIGALLDRLELDWHDRIFEPETTLTSLAEEALAPEPAALASALNDARGGGAYAGLVAEKEQLAAEGQAHIEGVLETIEAGAGVLVLDYSALETPRLAIAFTPFGVLRVDEDRSVFRLIPLQGRVGGMDFQQAAPRPLLQNRVRKQLVMPLSEAVTAAVLDRVAPGWRSGEATIPELALPGVTLTNVNAGIAVEGRRLTIRLR